MCYRTWKNHQIYQKLQEKEENLAIFNVIFMATFRTKNVHSASAKNGTTIRTISAS